MNRFDEWDVDMTPGPWVCSCALPRDEGIIKLQTQELNQLEGGGFEKLHRPSSNGVSCCFKHTKMMPCTLLPASLVASVLLVPSCFVFDLDIFENACFRVAFLFAYLIVSLSS